MDCHFCFIVPVYCQMWSRGHEDSDKRQTCMSSFRLWSPSSGTKCWCSAGSSCLSVCLSVIYLPDYLCYAGLPVLLTILSSSLSIPTEFPPLLNSSSYFCVFLFVCGPLYFIRVACMNIGCRGYSLFSGSALRLPDRMQCLFPRAKSECL